MRELVTVSLIQFQAYCVRGHLNCFKILILSCVISCGCYTRRFLARYAPELARPYMIAAHSSGQADQKSLLMVSY